MKKRIIILFVLGVIFTGCYNRLGKSSYAIKQQIYNEKASNYFYEDEDELEEEYLAEYKEQGGEGDESDTEFLSGGDGSVGYSPTYSQWFNRRPSYSVGVNVWDGMGNPYYNNVFGYGGYGYGGYGYGGYGYGGYGYGVNDWYYRQYNPYYNTWFDNHNHNRRGWGDRNRGTSGNAGGSYVPSQGAADPGRNQNDDINIRGKQFYRSNRNDAGSPAPNPVITMPQTFTPRQQPSYTPSSRSNSYPATNPSGSSGYGSPSPGRSGGGGSPMSSPSPSYSPPAPARRTMGRDR